MKRHDVIASLGLIVFLLLLILQPWKQSSPPDRNPATISQKKNINNNPAIPGTPSLVPVLKPDAVSPPTGLSTLHATPSKRLTKSPSLPLPEALAGFYAWSEKKRVRIVAAMMKDSNVSGEILSFYKRVLSDKSLSQHVRNIMSDVLHFQDKKDTTLYLDYIALIDDETNSDTWRDYCVQHLALALPYSEDPALIEAKLHEYVQTGPAHLAGQSMMMLGYLEGQGEVRLDDDFDTHLADLLRDESAEPKIQITALGLLAKHNAAGQIDVIREFAQTPSTTQRVAIATLGTIGTQEDIPLLESHLGSEDRLIAIAAKSALKRLKEKETSDALEPLASED